VEPEVDIKKCSKHNYDVLFVTKWKRNMNKILSVLFPQKFDYHESMDGAKIGTTEMPV